MGVSVTGERHWVRPRNVPILFISVFAVLAGVFYFLGPPLVPGLKNAAIEKCNELNGSNYRSYLLVWNQTGRPDWDLPHWECYDRRNPGELPVDFGWWVDPF